MPLKYPFSAVVGCEYDPTTASGLDAMGLALVLTSISPQIGGVLVRGEKGTAKSTTVRGLADVLPWIDVRDGDRFSADPHDPEATSPDLDADTGAVVSRPVRLVELPVGATEDRVLGSLNLEKALTAGAVEFEPGLLARAHRGVLYVDEVNLLHDHLVDLMLDAAATGQVTVERDGVSVGHSARFVLIGTMNPEEGELRPQLLDRFGLTVEVAAPRDPALRVEVVRRRLAFDRDPGAFTAAYAGRQEALTHRIEAARAQLDEVTLGDAALLKIAEVCAAFEVDGLRADIVTARTAVAHAAWAGRGFVTRADVRAAALLALPHRRRRNPFDAPGLDETLLDELLGDDELPEPPEPDGPTDSTDGPEAPSDAGQDPAAQTDASGADGSEADGAPVDTQGDVPEPASADQTEDVVAEKTPPAPPALPQSTGDGKSSTVRAGDAYRPRLFTVDGVGQGTPGRRSRALSSNGRRVGAAPGRGAGALHLVETLRAAAERHASEGPAQGSTRFSFEVADLRTAVREGREANLLLFCVDASGSMAARRRMAQVKTAILSLLTDAYRRRDKVAMVSFRGAEAALTLPPTASVEVAAALLDDLPAGGRTPLAEGLLTAADVVRRERLRDVRLRPLLVVVTDGRATLGADAVERSRLAAGHVAAMRVPSVVIDCEEGPLRLGLAQTLAAHLSAEHVPMARVSAAGLVDVVNGRVA
ncbi:magnesium chelatase subunit D family protein [Nocardioides sp.]|uniref:magnesium chelatase subunit D family protein n=1 Tax=Nocardioides sp. TaxID=35761 RepID=UPI00263964EB|nr:magnesium chelatase subunit D family protein [Nocardioides sp.]